MLIKLLIYSTSLQNSQITHMATTINEDSNNSMQIRQMPDELSKCFLNVLPSFGLYLSYHNMSHIINKAAFLK